MDYRLSPSDLTFLYDGCKHCFVLKVKYGIQQPSIPIPGVFSIIASLQKNHYSGKRLENLSHELPPGIIKYGEKYVKSKTLELPDCESTCYISGRFDIVAELDDGSYAILDFKTGSPNDEKSQMYAVRKTITMLCFSVRESSTKFISSEPYIKIRSIIFFSG